MFDLGSKQFEISAEISSLIWSNTWAVLTVLVALGGALSGLFYVVVKYKVVNTAEKRINEKMVDAAAREDVANLFLKTVTYRSQTCLVLELMEHHQGEMGNKYAELATLIAGYSYEHAKKLVESAQKIKSTTVDASQLQKYEDTLATASGNLAYALSQKEHPTELEKKRAQQLAKTLYESAVKNDNYHRIDTYAWVLIRCGANEDEKKRGRQILRELIFREDLPSLWRRSRWMKYYLIFGKDP